MPLLDAPSDTLRAVSSFLSPRERHALRMTCSVAYAAPLPPDARLRLSVANWAALPEPPCLLGHGRLPPFWGLRAACIELCSQRFRPEEVPAALDACRFLSLAGANPQTVSLRLLYLEFSCYVTTAINTIARDSPWPEALLELRNSSAPYDVDEFSADVLRRLAWCDSVLYTSFKAGDQGTPPFLPALRNVVVDGNAVYGQEEFAVRFGAAAVPALEVLDMTWAAVRPGSAQMAFLRDVCAAVSGAATPRRLRLSCRAPAAEAALQDVPDFVRDRIVLGSVAVRRPPDLVKHAAVACKLELGIAVPIAEHVVRLATTNTLRLPNLRRLVVSDGGETISPEGRQVCRDAVVAVVNAAPRLRKVSLCFAWLFDARLAGALSRSSVRRLKLISTARYVPPVSPDVLCSLPGPIRLTVDQAAYIRLALPVPLLAPLVTLRVLGEYGGWDLRWLEDPGPGPNFEVVSVRLSAASFGPRPLVSPAPLEQPPSRVPWNQSVRCLELCPPMGPGFAASVARLGSMFPNVKTLCTSYLLTSEEYEDVIRLAVAIGPSLIQAEGMSLLGFFNEPAVKLACPRLGVAKSR